MKWIYEPHPDQRAVGIACCDVVNRGASYGDGKIVYSLLDATVVAVDSETGKEVWRTRVGDINSGETFTAAPIIVKNHVLVGNSGGELGVRGYVAALDLKTGKEVWRAFNTGPGQRRQDRTRLSRVLREGPGQGSRRHLVAVRAMEAGRIHGLGLDLLRPGDESVLLRHRQSRRLESGSAPGRQQVVVDRSSRAMPTPARRAGPIRRPPTTPGTTTRSWRTCSSTWTTAAARASCSSIRDAPASSYVLDRETGELLSAETFQPTNWASGYDLKTGKPNEDPAKHTHFGTVTQGICPSSTGAKDVIPSAFSPRTGLLYIPAHNTCMDYEGIEANYIAGTPYLGADVKMYPGPGGYQGELVAWDVAHNRKAWGVKEDEVSRLQRRARHRRRRRVLRDDGRMVQGGRRANRDRALEVPRRVGHRRQPDHLSRAGRQAVRRRLLGHRRLDGRGRLSGRSPPTIPTPRSASSAR